MRAPLADLVKGALCESLPICGNDAETPNLPAVFVMLEVRISKEMSMFWAREETRFKKYTKRS